MEKNSEFKRLEKYVERLLENFAGIKDENGRLEHELQEQLSDNKRLKQKLERLESEKGEVSSRVGALIERIEDWEAELALPPDNDKSEDTDMVGAEKKNEANDAGEHSEGDERGGGIQTSLFSAES